MSLEDLKARAADQYQATMAGSQIDVVAFVDGLLELLEVSGRVVGVHRPSDR